jgi:hypothetical protein
MGTPIKLAAGNFGGYRALRDALLKGLCKDDLEKLATCSINVGDFAAKEAHGGDGNIWLIVNGEDEPNKEEWTVLRRQVRAKAEEGRHRFLILGNWWSEEEADHREKYVSSLWVPFASLSFTERKSSSPMDLLTKRNGGVRGFAARNETAVYAQSNCDKTREQFWDSLNVRLLQDDLPRGVAIGECNGFKKLGTHRHDKQRAFGYDHNVEANGHYKTCVTFDHATWNNRHGYITEKIVNSYLSGCSPIYHGAKQVGNVLVMWETSWSCAGIILVMCGDYPLSLLCVSTNSSLCMLYLYGRGMVQQ